MTHRHILPGAAIAMILAITPMLRAEEIKSHAVGRYQIATNWGTTDAQTACASSRHDDMSENLNVSGQTWTRSGSSFPGSWTIAPGVGTSGATTLVDIDPATGTLKARACAWNWGGPLYWENDSGRHEYSPYQTWGAASVQASTRRFLQASGTAPFDVTLLTQYDGDVYSDEGTTLYFDTISVVTRVKDVDTFFSAMREMEEHQAISWGFAEDFLLSTWHGLDNPYDMLFGEGQEVAEILASTDFIPSSTSDNGFYNNRDSEADAPLRGNETSIFTVQPGELILVDNLLKVDAAAFNPMFDTRSFDLSTNTPDFLEADGDFMSTVTSDLIIDPTSDGSFDGYEYFAVPEPATMALFGAGALTMLRKRRRR